MKKNKFVGSSFDSFLEDEGMGEAVEAVAIKRVIAFELEKKMKKTHLTKKQTAEKMGTSRSALDRLLNPKNTSITLNTLIKATHFIGKKLLFSFA
ncbi:MAG TPA: helix-turn-helix transcriptional regulator [Coxiellaceae bacterium]|nr:MAG: Fis family transcriptional regulator [Gammaproteobacteria bacterium RIFCSPHIGHO2_12_FULL_36_30]HLB56672.1 helix-turn-helix transcriptional regulator [Coxiellaceae bacterium]